MQSQSWLSPSWNIPSRETGFADWDFLFTMFGKCQKFNQFKISIHQTRQKSLFSFLSHLIRRYMTSTADQSLIFPCVLLGTPLREKGFWEWRYNSTRSGPPTKMSSQFKIVRLCCMCDEVSAKRIQWSGVLNQRKRCRNFFRGFGPSR